MPRAKTAKPPEFEEPAAPEPVASGMNQSQAIRAAIAAGHDMPAEGIPYIKENFGLEIKPTSFSAVKANEKKKSGPSLTAKPGRKRKAEWPVAPSSPKPTKGEPDIMDSLETLKPLVATLGVDRLKRLIDFLA